jgi:hypothetical protein
MLDTLSRTPVFEPKWVGDITVFAIDSSTGRLQLVPNQQIADSNQTQLSLPGWTQF